MQQTPTSASQQRQQRQQSSPVQINSDGLNDKDIKSIQLADGWHNVQECELLPSFAVGRSQSPLTPNATWTYFRYVNEHGMEVFTPARAILGISAQAYPGTTAEQVSQGLGSLSPQKAGSFGKS